LFTLKASPIDFTYSTAHGRSACYQPSFEIRSMSTLRLINYICCMAPDLSPTYVLMLEHLVPPRPACACCLADMWACSTRSHPKNLIIAASGCCTLQDPVTVKHSKRLYRDDESKVSIIDFLGVKLGNISPVPGVQVAQQGSEIALSISSVVPNKAAWLQFSLERVNVVQGRSYVDNLTTRCAYEPSEPYVLIYEVTEGRNDRIKDFYWCLWFGDEIMPKLDVHETFYDSEVTITAADIETWRRLQPAGGGVQNDAVRQPRPLVERIQDRARLAASPRKRRLQGEARPTAVINSDGGKTDGGKTVKTQSYVTVDGECHLCSFIVDASILNDYQNTFETAEEPDYLVELNSDPAVGVLQSKEWFEWDEKKPLQAGTGLIFRLKSEVTYKDKVNYHSVSVMRDVFVRDQLKRLVKVGSVEFEHDDCQGNPIVAYLQRNGAPQDKPTSLANDYTLHSHDSHEELSVKIKLTCVQGGNMVIKVETFNSRGDKVLEGAVQVAQPATIYVFTSQGLQEPAMGMDPYNNSPATRADGTNEHLLAVYGFSIVEIVKDNPKEKTIHFGGIKGQVIRQRYMDMTYDTMNKDGDVKTLPLLTDVNVRMLSTPSATHPDCCSPRNSHRSRSWSRSVPRSRTCVGLRAAFVGHSLEEYSALASITDVLLICLLVDVIFYHGITMQSAVEHDSQDCSNCAMCAVNPSRISKMFNDAALREVVYTISHCIGCLLEIVNLNVEYSQGQHAYLSKKINAAHLNPDLLEGKYVPNLVVKPFAATKDYAHSAHQGLRTAPLRPDVVAVLEQASAGPVVTNIEDFPMKATDILATIVGQKLKKKIKEIPLSKSIKDLLGGNEELPLKELGSALGQDHSGSLGKYTIGLVSGMVGAKMPGGFMSPAIKAHLAKMSGLGPAHADAILLLGTTVEPPKRLGSEAEGKACKEFLEFLKFQADQEQFAAQHMALYMRYR
ncbi:hypothetical protein EWM64_g9633, partial [Hericium alpestre]